MIYKDPRLEKTKEQKQTSGRKQSSSKNVGEDTDSETELYSMFRTLGKEKPYVVQVSFDGVTTEMEVDTGTSLSVISEVTLAGRRSRKVLIFHVGVYQEAEDLHRGGNSRTMCVSIFSFLQEHLTPKTEVKGPCWLGRDWLKEIQLDWSEIVLFNATTTERHRVDTDPRRVFRSV